MSPLLQHRPLMSGGPLFRMHTQSRLLHRLPQSQLPRHLKKKSRTRKRDLRLEESLPIVTRGPLSYLLRNRFFVGEVVYKGEPLPGPQQPILERALFDAVQAKLADQDNNHIRTRLRSEALLVGKIYDDIRGYSPAQM
jgi:Recombinase